MVEHGVEHRVEHSSSVERSEEERDKRRILMADKKDITQRKETLRRRTG